jgi:hypothetical protein
MARLSRFALVLVLVPVACGKIKAPGDETTVDAPVADARPIDASEHLTPPVAALTTLGFAGTSVQCTVATPASGPGTISYQAAWTLSGFPFTDATTTMFAGDTLPGTVTHDNGVATCTLFATNGTETVSAAAVSTMPFKARLAYVASGLDAATLQTIDLDTFAVTTIGSFGVTYEFGDIAWDAVHQKLFMVDGRGAEALYTVNVATGSATEIGAYGLADMFGLGFDGSGNLYGGVQNPAAGVATLQLANQATGAMTGIGGTVGISGLAFDTKRSMMVALAVGSTNGQLQSVDLATGSQTQLSSDGTLNDLGLTYDPLTDAFYAADFSGNLYRYDPANGYTRTLVHAFAGGEFTGIAMILPPP